jgi:hypothetical protein
MSATFTRIGMYAKLHGSLPSSLEGLPEYDGPFNEREPIDGWNRPLQYRVDGDGVITLTSFGKDGKPGGWGFNADYSMSYYSRRKDGSLWAGQEAWVVNGRVMK